MKKLLLLCFAFALLLVPAFTFAASCDSTEDEYFIKFTFEGEEYTCSFGHPDSEVDVPYAAVTTSLPIAALNGPLEFIQFFGATWNPTSSEDPSFLIQVGGRLYVFTAGEYTGEYALPELGTVWIWIMDGEAFYYYMASEGSITIDSFGEIGEAIEGSFNATFTLSGDFVVPAGIGDDNQTVTGTFRVKRVSEEDLPEPEIN